MGASLLRGLTVRSASVSRAYCKVTAPAPVPCACNSVHRCKLLVVGGGTGGCSIAWRFSNKLKYREIIVLEPSQYHYYQPLFTLIAAGMKPFDESRRPLGSVLPRNVTWFKDRAEGFDPCNNMVYTRCGDKICYEYMVVAMGLVNDYDQITGLKSALDNPSSCVCTIYSPEYCHKTWCCIRGCRGGHAVFTFPVKGGKCSGAAQKIMYLADDYWRHKKCRKNTSITYCTGGDALFGVDKYARALNNVASKRDISVNLHSELLEVTPKGAVFSAGCSGQTMTLPYNLLHVTPPMCPPGVLRGCDALVNCNGYLDIHKHTLQHTKYPNVYGIGDCTSTPNSKTAAAVAEQSHILEQNLTSTMRGAPLNASYNGYGACPMLTSYSKGILAEFIYGKKPHETLPFDQVKMVKTRCDKTSPGNFRSKEHRMVCTLKKHYFPYLYWNKLIKGKWDGPGKLRKVLNPLGK